MRHFDSWLTENTLRQRYKDPLVNIFQHNLSIFLEPNKTRKYIQ